MLLIVVTRMELPEQDRNQEIEVAPDAVDTSRLKERTIKSLFWKLLERGGNQLVTLIVQIVLARILNPGDFGTLAIIIVFVNIGAVFVQSGLNTALVQAPEANSEDYSTVFYICLTISLILYIALFLAAPQIESFYQVNELASFLRAIALLLPIGALNSVQVAIITRELRLRSLFVATLIGSVSSGVLGIGMALAGFGLWSLVAQQLAMQAISAIVMIPLSRWVPKLEFSLAKAKQHLGFGWKLLAASLIGVLYNNLYDLIIGKVFSVADLGYFNQGKKIPSVTESLFDSTIASVMLSAAAKLQDEKEKLKALTRRAMQLTTYMVAPMMALLAVTATPLVSLIFTDKWLPCVPYLQLFAIACSLTPVTTSNLQAINAMGRSDVVLKLEIVKKSIAVAILLFTSLVIGDMMAIAVGNLVYSVIAVGINMGPLKALLDYNRINQIKDIIPSFIIATASGAITTLIGLAIDGALLQLVVQIGVFIFTYVLLSIAFKLEAFSYLTALCKDGINAITTEH